MERRCWNSGRRCCRRRRSSPSANRSSCRRRCVCQCLCLGWRTCSLRLRACCLCVRLCLRLRLRLRLRLHRLRLRLGVGAHLFVCLRLRLLLRALRGGHLRAEQLLDLAVEVVDKLLRVVLDARAALQRAPLVVDLVLGLDGPQRGLQLRDLLLARLLRQPRRAVHHRAQVLHDRRKRLALQKDFVLAVKVVQRGGTPAHAQPTRRLAHHVLHPLFVLLAARGRCVFAKALLTCEERFFKCIGFSATCFKCYRGVPRLGGFFFSLSLSSRPFVSRKHAPQSGNA